MPVRRVKEDPVNYPIALQFKRVLQLFRDSVDEKLRPYGVTAAQLHVLIALEREPGTSGAELARTCRVTPQTIQVATRTIEANGWIRRTRHPENDRILLATLTSSGKRMLTRSRKVIAQIYTGMLDGFTAADVAVLETMLSQCAANLESRKTDTSQLS